MKYLNFLIIIFLVSCSTEGGSDLTPPAAVEMVEKTTDLGNVERGIDAVPDKDAVYIEWYLLNDINISSYNIYRKAANEAYPSKIATIPVEGSYDTTYFYVDSNDIYVDDTEYLYYYYVTAVNKDGVEGAKPDSLEKLKYRLLSKANTFDILDTITVTNLPYLRWDYQVDSHYYIVRIEEMISEKLIWAKQFENDNYGSGEGDLDLGDATKVPDPPVFLQGVWYRWRIDKVGTDPDPLSCGSESNWKYFRVF